MRALSIRQPHAEAIMRGVKPIEYRNRLTNVQGRIYTYAAKGRMAPEDEAKMMKAYRIMGVACDDLPRGVLIGTVELFDCTEGKSKFNWKLRKPERARKLLKPKKHPQPSWFTPFGKQKATR
jgi:hypothetical protein